ncbi:hypothetical protein QQ045_031625 [Rhodiola kirilowii]
MILPSIISQEQAGFMSGWGTIESVTLAHDLTCHINNGRAGGNVVMKIDMAKAYDRVSWLFLHRMMRALGFSSQWCDLVYRTISGCFYSVLWDGTAYGRFKSNRGVRQGDPLSPSLFIICMESFSRLLHRHISDGLLQPYFVKTGALQVNHLLYADDLLLFTNGTEQSIKNLMHMINRFCTWTGQALNSSKSNIFFPQAMDTEHRQDLLQATGFSEGKFPTTITLVETVLNSMAIHVLASLPTPAAVINRINSLLANFIWDSGGQSRRHWVSWPDICRDKRAGGLGIRNLNDIRKGFQYKLAWRCMDPSSLWGRFVRSTYKEGHHGSHIWTFVSKVLPDLRNQCRWNIGRGDLTVSDFCWLYQSSPPHALQQVPLHTIVSDPNLLATVSATLPPHGQQELQMISISDQADCLEWRRSVTGMFTTKEFRIVTSTPSPLDKALSTVWHPWIPPKISAFMWRLKHRAIPTDDRIKSCGIHIASACLCCTAPHEETAAHLFVDGEEATKIWTLGKNLLDVPQAGTLKQLWDFLIRLSINPDYIDGLRIIWICCSLWELWVLRNKFLHEALFLPTPYNPKARWKKWTPHPSGLTLNVAWYQSDEGLRGAYILWTNTGAVVHCSVTLHLPTTTGLAHTVRSLRAKGLTVQACQSCHPDISSHKPQNGRHAALHGILFAKICRAANTPAFILASANVPTSAPELKKALKGDRLGLPSECHRCPFHDI